MANIDELAYQVLSQNGKYKGNINEVLYQWLLDGGGGGTGGGIGDSPVGRWLRTTGAWLKANDLPENVDIIMDENIDKPIMRRLIGGTWKTIDTFGSLETNKVIANKAFGGFRMKDINNKEVHAVKQVAISETNKNGSALAYGNYESEEGHYITTSKSGVTMVKRDWEDLSTDINVGEELIELNYYELSYVPKTLDMLCVSYDINVITPKKDMIYNMALYQVIDGKEVIITDFNDDNSDQDMWINGYRNPNYKITLIEGINKINLPIPVPAKVGQELIFKIWFDEFVTVKGKDNKPQMKITGNKLFFDKLVTAREGTEKEMKEYCSDTPMLFYNTTDKLTYYGNSMWTWHKLGTDWDIPMDVANGKNLNMLMQLRERFDYIPKLEDKSRFNLNLLPTDLFCDVHIDEYRNTDIVARIGRQLVYIPPIIEEGEPVEQEQEHYRLELTCTDLPIEDFSNCEIWMSIDGDRYITFPDGAEKGITILDSDDSEMELKSVEVNHHVLGDSVRIELTNSYSKKLSINIDHRFKYENNKLTIRLICFPLSDEVKLIDKNLIADSLIGKDIARTATSVSKYKHLTTDFLTMFDRSGLYRCFGMTDHIPDGYNIGDNDFYVNVFDTSENYKVLEALDIRSGRRHTLTMYNGKWDEKWTEQNLPLVPKVIYSKTATNKGVEQVIPLTTLNVTEKDTLMVNCGSRGIAVRVDNKTSLNSYASAYHISDETGEFTYYLDDEGFGRTLIEISKYTPIIPTPPARWIPKLTLLDVEDISVGIPEFEQVGLQMNVLSWELIRDPEIIMRGEGGEAKSKIRFDGKERYYFGFPFDGNKLKNGEEIMYRVIWNDQLGVAYEGEERVVKIVN